MAEKEYIERGALIDYLRQEITQCEDELGDSYGDDCYKQAVNSRMIAMLNVSHHFMHDSADVAPVMHGSWKETFYNGMWHYDCPFCDDGYATGQRDEAHYNYCPNCGAKMDGERKEQQ